ncbi:hypothetical protein BHE74_00039715 [Ensete ventricosum]|nr:hypothetical protein BHE74_00039715 [Ensete ventricosum]
MPGVGCAFQRSIAVRLVSPPPTAVVQQPLLLPPPVVTPSVAPKETGVPAASPSSTDVGGGELPIIMEELEALLASTSSSFDHGGEQHCTDDAFFTREVDAPVMSDATDTASTTIPKASPSGLVDVLLIPDDARIDSTTSVVEVSLSSPSIDFVVSEQMYCTDDYPFFTSLEKLHALRTFSKSVQRMPPSMPISTTPVAQVCRSLRASHHHTSSPSAAPAIGFPASNLAATVGREGGGGAGGCGHIGREFESLPDLLEPGRSRVVLYFSNKLA